jgi:hypothetical protein
MKTKFYWIALLASAALITQTQAGSHGGGGGGGTFAAPSAPGHGAPSSSRYAPMRSFSAGRMIYSGQRFSPIRSAAFHQPHISSNGGASVRARQFTPGNIDRGNRTRFSNTGTSNRQVRSGNNASSNWRNHVVAQHSASWHRDWDRSHDHWWHGHRCRFVNGSWFIFDFGFDPWWPYWYPYGYYGYPYGYDPGYYNSGEYEGQEYYDQNNYGSSDQYNDSAVAAAQEQLARQGYYRGQIDGVFGPETRRAIERYQSSHHLRVTGSLTTDTLDSLGLSREPASN